MIEKIRVKNPKLKIMKIDDPSFLKYGNILKIYNISEMEKYFINLEVPNSGNNYIAHDPSLELVISNTSLFDDVFGYVKLQYGYVLGHNQQLNALEFHKSSEINIAFTDMVVFVGGKELIKDKCIDSLSLETFYIPKGTVIEFNPYTLHFSPCEINQEGFKCGVILPYGTNMEFLTAENKNSFEDELLFKTNKWLIAHTDNEQLLLKGAYPGITGENLKIKY